MDLIDEAEKKISEASNKIFSLGDLLKREFPPISWVVDKLIPRQGLVALSGIPGSYKSWLAQYIALHVAGGKSLFSRFNSQPGSVLIIDRENNYALIQSRFQQLGADKELPIYFYDSDLAVENDSSIEEIVQIIQDKKLLLVVIDSLIRIHRQNENEKNREV